MSNPKGSAVLDGLIAMNIILELIESFQRSGIEIDLSNIDEMLAERKANRRKQLKDLGLID